MDFHVYYDGKLGAGDLSLGIAGTKTTRSFSNFGTPTNELGVGGPQLVFTSLAGDRVNGFSTRLTWNFSGAYKDSAPDVNGVLGQRIKPFAMFNLNLGYEFGEDAGALSGTSLRLTVDNLFEKKPQITPRSLANIVTYQNWTLGRVIKMGFSKKF